jgi:hypothetical protein
MRRDPPRLMAEEVLAVLIGYPSGAQPTTVRMFQVMNPQKREPDLLSRILPGRVVHAAHRIASVGKHRSGILPERFLNHLSRYGVEHNESVFTIFYPPLPRNDKNRRVQLRYFNLIIPLQTAHFQISESRVYREQAHLEKMKGENAEQFLLLFPRQGIRRPLIAPREQPYLGGQPEAK